MLMESATGEEGEGTPVKIVLNHKVRFLILTDFCTS
jgi:hypothetical protein